MCFGQNHFVEMFHVGCCEQYICQFCIEEIVECARTSNCETSCPFCMTEKPRFKRVNKDDKVRDYSDEAVIPKTTLSRKSKIVPLDLRRSRSDSHLIHINCEELFKEGDGVARILTFDDKEDSTFIPVLPTRKNNSAPSNISMKSKRKQTDKEPTDKVIEVSQNKDLSTTIPYEKKKSQRIRSDVTACFQCCGVQ